jgi:hypothetical protein
MGDMFVPLLFANGGSLSNSTISVVYSFNHPLTASGSTVTVAYDNTSIKVNGSNQLYSTTYLPDVSNTPHVNITLGSGTVTTITQNNTLDDGSGNLTAVTLNANNGASGTVTIPQITPVSGTQGSIVVVNGIITSFTNPT